MTLTEILALASLAVSILGVGSNVALYIHLNSTVTTRFSELNAHFDTRFDLLLTKVVDVDNRLTRVEERMNIPPK